MIEIKNLSKKYKNVIGNHDINFQVERGEAVGIVGPNGAGKTTLIKQIMGFIKPDSGEIKINNYIPWKESDKISSFTSYLSGDFLLYEEMTGNDFFKFTHNFQLNPDKEYLKYLISFFELDPSKKIKSMSKGTKQKVALIAMLCSKPELLILDEPTTGLDPKMMQKFNNMINTLKENNCTILVCSHIFQEISKFCDRIIFIKEGTIIKEMKVNRDDIKNIEEEFLKIYGDSEKFKYE